MIKNIYYLIFYNKWIIHMEREVSKKVKVLKVYILILCWRERERERERGG